MGIQINHASIEGSNLEFEPATFFKGPKIIQDGIVLKNKKGKVTVNNKNNVQIELKIKRSLLDPINKIEINGETILLAPPLKWYQYVWMGLPIIIAVDRGLLSKVIGLVTVRTNFQLFRSDKPTFQKYLQTGLLSVSATAAYIAIIWWILQLTKK